MKAVVAAFNQEKALVGAFSVITNLRMELFEPVVWSARVWVQLQGQCQAQQQLSAKIRVYRRSGRCAAVLLLPATLEQQRCCQGFWNILKRWQETLKIAGRDLVCSVSGQTEHREEDFRISGKRSDICWLLLFRGILRVCFCSAGITQLGELRPGLWSTGNMKQIFNLHSNSKLSFCLLTIFNNVYR